ATSQPSFSIESVRKPPPGATITAAPLALPSAGRKGGRVASVTLRANMLPYWLCHDSDVVAPGSGAVPRAIAVGCAGDAIAVIVSSCAMAGAVMKARAAAGPSPAKQKILVPYRLTAVVLLNLGRGVLTRREPAPFSPSTFTRNASSWRATAGAD